MFQYKQSVICFTLTAPWKGYHYGITKFGNEAGYARGIVYNEIILERLGMNNVWDYVENGTWTWEVFLNIAKQATQDLNGDGIIDQWGLCTRTIEDLATLLVYSNGGSIVEEAGDTFRYTLNSQKSIKALQFMSDLYNVHQVITNDRDWLNDLKNGKAAFAVFPLGSYSGTFLTEPDIASKIFIAPMAKGPDADNYI